MHLAAKQYKYLMCRSRRKFIFINNPSYKQNRVKSLFISVSKASNMIYLKKTTYIL